MHYIPYIKSSFSSSGLCQYGDPAMNSTITSPLLQCLQIFLLLLFHEALPKQYNQYPLYYLKKKNTMVYHLLVYNNIQSTFYYLTTFKCMSFSLTKLLMA